MGPATTADFWYGQRPEYLRSTSRTSTESGASTEYCAAGYNCHPAAMPLGRLNTALQRSTSSWQLHATVISSNFAPHPAVRPLAIWDEKTLDEDERNQHTLASKEDETIYPKSLALALIILGVCLSVFIISLDRSIVTTAIPAITADFNSVDNIGWYGSAYLLTASAFQPLYGRIYTLPSASRSSFLGCSLLSSSLVA